jgi:peptidoglycan/xylan/chitin deacetylase (PgdA/CDA1 family)
MEELAQPDGRTRPASDETIIGGQGGRGGMLRGDVVGSARAVFADRRPVAGQRSLWTTIAGKASRMLARCVATKTMRKAGPEPLVSFTFDDAAATSCREGAAILEDHGMRGTYYICAGGCGTASPSGQLASADDIRSLLARGHEIGCHTYSHRAVSTLGRDELAEELDRNAAALRDICGGVAPRNFAFPYGDLTLGAKLQLARRFDSCRTIRPGLNAGTIDLGALRSWSLENASINRAKIVKLIEQTVRRHGWLIFSSHGLEAIPGRFTITPDLFAFTVATAKAAGCRPTTIAEGLRLAAGDVRA